MDISARKKEILRTIIERYINTAEPVGSKAIAAECGLSSATIRNEMAELEEFGYLEQPHTSAGRIPTAFGYRMYVNELMGQHKLSIEDTEAINDILLARIQQLDKIIANAGKVASQLTNYPAYTLAAVSKPVTISRFDFIYVDANTFIIVAMLSSNTVKNKLIHTLAPVEQMFLTKLSTMFNASFTDISEENITAQLIYSTERASGDTSGLVATAASFVIEILMESKQSETYLSGAAHLLEQPEYQNVDKAQKLMRYLSDGEELLRLPAPDDESDVKIVIGPENVAEELKDSSVIVAKYNAGSGMQGLIGVVGPTRMDYPKVASRLSYITKRISGLLSGNEFPPLGLYGNKDDD